MNDAEANETLAGRAEMRSTQPGGAEVLAPTIQRLTKRAEFLAVAQGARSARRGFVLQASMRDDRLGSPRCGFTVTKKMGNAPVRNRIRRRLREAIRLHGDLHARPRTDYVLVGREEALALAFDVLTKDLAAAFRQAHARLDGHEAPDRGRPPGRHKKPSGGRKANSASGPANSGDTSTGRTE